MTKIDIVITTYNRSKKVLELIGQLMDLINNGECIIVVDSSDNENIDLKEKKFIRYLRSKHKNQPYQRYLGYLSSEAEWIVFLDDDMEIANLDVMKKLRDLVSNTTSVGFALKFRNKHLSTPLFQIPESILFKKNRVLRKIKGVISGYPDLKPGKLGFCGNRGPQPIGGGPTEWVSGGAFAAKRADLFQNFNYQLFDVYEKGLGKGEDAIIGYGLSNRGNLTYVDELFFLHNDQGDSVYTINHYSFACRVTFSRLFLSLERARLKKKNLVIPYLHFNYYLIWRFFGCLLNYLYSPTKARKMILFGTAYGWWQAVFFSFSSNTIDSIYWHDQAKKDNAFSLIHNN